MKTFEELCKTWSEVKQMKLGICDARIEALTSKMNHPKSCVVGEAYGFNGDYYYPYYHGPNPKFCRECKYFADDFTHGCWGHGGRFGGCWDNEIPEFVKHFNEKHLPSEGKVK
jgi:hypothetical protein